METEILLTDAGNFRASIARAAELLQKGSVVAIPTETVYGLAANALNPTAVSAVFAAKGRPADNPLIVHIADMGMLPPLIANLPELAKRLMAEFWPGPLTIILPRSPAVPLITTGGLETVAVRMPSHPIAMKIIRACGLPLAAPSANLSGSPSPTTLEHCVADLNGRVPAIVDGGVCDFGVESTVLDCSVTPPRLLRPGAVTTEQIESVVGKILVDRAVTEALPEGAKAASPGMKYKHYSPKAEVFVVKGDLGDFAELMRQKSIGARDGEKICAMVFDGEADFISLTAVEYGARGNHEQQAHSLFDRLRQLDEMNVTSVFVRCPETDGMGLAVFNRLIRAAGFKIIDLSDKRK